MKRTRERVYSLNFGGWALIGELIRTETLPVETIATVAKVHVDSWIGDQAAIVEYVLSLCDDHGQLVRFREVIRLAGLGYLIPADQDEDNGE